MWQLPIIDGPVPWICYGLAVALLLLLAIRRWTRAAIIGAIIGAIVGGAVGLGIALVADAVDAFGIALLDSVKWWVAAAMAASGFALGSMFGTRAWRKVIAIVSVPVFLISAAVGINADYGLDPTLGSLFGIQDKDELTLPLEAGKVAAPAPDSPIYTTWKAPADIPTVGTRGSAAIPATKSGFHARPAGIYLPPAALVKDAPPLPLVVMMMGYVGNPDPTAISDVLDKFAAENNGLAPIVVVADQVGADGNDPACADSTAYGNARTYVNTDVVAWAKENLHIIDDPKYWVIAGYSNGGGCAIAYGSAYPQQWPNIIDVSGEEFPGSEQIDNVTATIYGGDAAAFEASKPINIMAAAPPGTYAKSTGVMTAGANDPDFLIYSQRVSTAAKAAGMTATQFTVPGADHGTTAISGGLTEGFTIIYPVLGLSAH